MFNCSPGLVMTLEQFSSLLGPVDLRHAVVEIRLSNDSLPFIILMETCGMIYVVINLHLDLNLSMYVNILRQVNKTGWFF